MDPTSQKHVCVGLSVPIASVPTCLSLPQLSGVVVGCVSVSVSVSVCVCVCVCVSTLFQSSFFFLDHSIGLLPLTWTEDDGATYCLGVQGEGGVSRCGPPVGRRLWEGGSPQTRKVKQFLLLPLPLLLLLLLLLLGPTSGPSPPPCGESSHRHRVFCLSLIHI